MAKDRRAIKVRLEGIHKTRPGMGQSADYQLWLLRSFDLPPLCREVVVLREVCGHPVPEIAELLGVRRRVVEKCLRRAQRIQPTEKVDSPES
jgi:DNA-directed RNA polymerase specialized sigma24 family protein